MRKLKILDEDQARQIAAEQFFRAMRGQRDEARRELANMERAYDILQGQLDRMAAIQNPRPGPAFRVKSTASMDAGVSMAVWSDWHVAEKVDARKVGGLNRYNPELAEKRAATCASSTAKLHRHVAASYKVEDMLLFLGGDFITGYLHPELEQTNAMGPVEEAQYAQDLLIRGIQTLLAESKLRRLRIVCMRGNHGRTTKKIQFKNDHETSLESMVYATLARYFVGEKRITFDIPQGDVHYVELVPGWLVRFYHGHQISYSDGIGGLTIPLNKWQAKQDRTKQAHFNLMGHYHHYSLPNSRTILCGSLKGYDEYCSSKGMPFQEPLQAFCLLDAGRKMAAQHYPIFCT